MRNAPKKKYRVRTFAPLVTPVQYRSTHHAARRWLARHEAGGVVEAWADGVWTEVERVEREHPCDVIAGSGSPEQWEWVRHPAIVTVLGVDEGQEGETRSGIAATAKSIPRPDMANSGQFRPT